MSATFLLSSCRDAGRALNGPTRADAAAARQFLDVLAARYTTPQRLPNYESSRSRIAHNAFVPSNAWRDSTIWTASPSANVRQVHAFGRITPAGYRLGSDEYVPQLRGPADSRHTVSLTRLGGGDLYRWETLADYHVGVLEPRRMGEMFTALLGAPEGRNDRQVRADYLAAFPRTASAMGRYASLDTVRAVPQRDGSSVTRVVISLHAGRLARTYPALAAYLERYTTRSRARFVVRDRSGTPAPATWLVLDARNNRITIDYRSRGGALVPSNGAARAFPDTLELVIDAIATVGPFTAGFERMHTQLARARTAREHSWEINARQEPEWKLPLFTERLLRTPLRRPFEGAGGLFVLGVQMQGDASVLHRYGRVTVQESAILRFFNRLGSRAFGDISPQVEAEEAAFLRLIFVAMRDDLAALTGD